MRRLTEAAQYDRDAFEAAGGSCSCHLNPPCGYCTDAGNPLNQEEDDTCWEEVDDEEATTCD